MKLKIKDYIKSLEEIAEETYMQQEDYFDLKDFYIDVKHREKEHKKAFEILGNLNIIVDHILENEYKNFQENCECDIDVCVDNWEVCKCQTNHIYYIAQKVYKGLNNI